MWRNIGGHPHGDTARSVDQEIGQPRRQHSRLLQPVVEVGLEVDRVLVDVVQHGHRHTRQPRLGVTVGRRPVAVDGAEIALAGDQRIPEREILYHPHEGIVDRTVAVRVILAQYIAHHGSALLERPPGREPQLVHGVENAPVHRLESVAHVRQRPGHDDAHRVVDERLLHLFFDEPG